MPTLKEVLDLVSKRAFINIELKVPYEEEPRSRYDYHEAADLTHELLRSQEMQEHCWISSFNHDILRCIEDLNTARPADRVRTIYLHNFLNHLELPPLEQVTQTGWGVNISYEHLTEEVVKACHAAGQIVAVWIDAGHT